MITLSIRYTIDPMKLAEFEAYAKALPEAAERCGARAVAYYLPTNSPARPIRRWRSSTSRASPPTSNTAPIC